MACFVQTYNHTNKDAAIFNGRVLQINFHRMANKHPALIKLSYTY
jgi:hypothetical protein